MNTYKKLYQEYKQEVECLEEEFKKSGGRAKAHLVINDRMQVCDEYLYNHTKWMIPLKTKLMPLIMEFLAEYSSKDDATKTEFDNIKEKDQYGIYLEELIKALSPFEEHCQKQIKYSEYKERDLVPPIKPYKRNAVRKLSQYYEDDKEYEAKLESFTRIKIEAEQMLSDYKEKCSLYKT